MRQSRGVVFVKGRIDVGREFARLHGHVQTLPVGLSYKQCGCAMRPPLMAAWLKKAGLDSGQPSLQGAKGGELNSSRRPGPQEEKAGTKGKREAGERACAASLRPKARNLAPGILRVADPTIKTANP